METSDAPPARTAARARVAARAMVAACARVASRTTISTPPLAPDVEAELFRRQLVAAMVVALRANVANAANIVALAVYVAMPAHPRFAVVWMATALPGTALRAVVWWWGGRSTSRRHDVRLIRHYYRVSLVEVTVQGVNNAVLLGFLLPRVDSGRQVMLVGSLAGVMGAGAVALSTVRSVGSLWVVLHLAAAVPIFLSMRRPAYDLMAVQFVVYSGVLVVGVAYLSDSFRRRTLAEVTARHSQHFVELLLDDFEDGSRDWLWETDAAGRLTHASDRLAEVSGRPVTALRRMTLVELLGHLAHPSPEGTGSLHRLTDAMERGAGIRDHLLRVEVDGSDRWWSISAKPRRMADGSIIGWRGVGADATQAHVHALEMVRLAQTDPLTELANRRLFQQTLESVLGGDPTAGEVHLAIFDLDNFKTVNDTLGHSVGDELLTQVATRLAAHSETDFVARLGGDEFAVVTQPRTAPDFPELVFAAYQEVFARPFTVRGNRLRVSASVGCARAVPRTTGAEELVGRADLALYAAKASGAGRMTSFRPDMALRARARSSMLADLERAIRDDEFVFHYQAQHDLVSGKVVATEALLRWQHPRRGLLAPSEFLEVAEESGLLVPIGALMLVRACRKLASLDRGVRLALNVSQAELDAVDFVDRLEAAVAESGVDPGRLELEVTETAAATPHTEAVLREVRQLGVRVAVDDFGVGYSSLGRLQRMPVDVLKVDRAFASLLRSDSSRTRAVTRAIMKSAVDIARALGIQVLAEGIEEADQLTAVRLLGFDLVQGYFLATPAPDVTRHLRLVSPPDDAG